MHILHHGEGEASGFDGFTVLIILGIVAAVAAVGFLIWKLVGKRRYG